MSYIALYRKWRPSVFEDVVEQEHVVRTLKNSVSTGRIAHAYLFCGTRGTGKTTMAHILSRAINCLSPKDGDPCNECEVCRGILSGSILDVLEIDAASNNSVDNIREIRDEVIYAPTRAKYKVYIIDEVHMLSSGAFNALLKTLEEPPAHVVFILATTEPHKLPATILSRCQRFDFRRITAESIIGRLEKIAADTGTSIRRDAAGLIARLSDGALRDAISLLDQCISLGVEAITYDNVLSVAGIVQDDFIAELVDALLSRDAGAVLELVEKLVMDGKDIVHFTSDLILYFRNLLICKITDKPEEVIEAPAEAIEGMKRQAPELTRGQAIGIIKELSALEPILKWTTQPRILLEVNLLKLCSEAGVTSEDLGERVAALEKKLSEGLVFSQPMAANPSVNTAPVNSDASALANFSASPSPQRVNKQNKDASEKSAPDLRPAGAVLDEWPRVIADLKKSGRMALYASLADTKALKLEEKVIAVLFKKGAGFNKMNCSRAENLEVIEGVLNKLLGREVRVKCLDEEDAAELKPGEKKEPGDEFVEKARDIARKLNAPLNILDE